MSQMAMLAPEASRPPTASTLLPVPRYATSMPRLLRPYRHQR